jgi:hypothetical protein
MLPTNIRVMSWHQRLADWKPCATRSDDCQDCSSPQICGLPKTSRRDFTSSTRQLGQSHALITLSRSQSRAMGTSLLELHREIHVFDLTWKWSWALRHRPDPATSWPAGSASPSHGAGESDCTRRFCSTCAIWTGRLGGGSARCIPPLVGRVPLSSQYATSKPIRASLLTMADTADDLQCLASQRTQELRALCKVPFA